MASMLPRSSGSSMGARQVSTATSSPRTVTTSPIVGISYNAGITYNSHITYQQVESAGAATARQVAMAGMGNRQVSTATMKAR